jgi:hypothetical protein
MLKWGKFYYHSSSSAVIVFHNPTTKISYYVPNSQYVELKVFDVLGNEITTLVRGVNNAGLHTVESTKSSLAMAFMYTGEISQYLKG